MTTNDTSGPKFTLGAYHYSQIKQHDTGVYLFELTSAYNNPTDPGQGWAVVLKNFPNWNMPTDAMHNFAFSRDQKEIADRLLDMLVATPKAARCGVGRGFLEDMRRRPAPLPQLF